MSGLIWTGLTMKIRDISTELDRFDNENSKLVGLLEQGRKLLINCKVGNKNSE
jgi:hypothetical protein